MRYLIFSLLLAPLGCTPEGPSSPFGPGVGSGFTEEVVSPFTTVFSTRGADNAPDATIEDAITDLINRAVPGSRIRIALFSFTRNPVTDALLAAQARGVDVQLVLDGGADETAGTEVPRLISELGAGRVHLCDAPGTSCLGTGIMHHKSFLFSELDDGSRDVVVQASHNMTNSQLSLHNNAVIIRGDAALFAAYEQTFNDLLSDIEEPNYAHSVSGDSATRVFFFPRASGDTAVSILDNVECDATSQINVLMAFFTDGRTEVADALAARAREGCQVTVVVGDAEIPLGDTVAQTLVAGGVELVRYPERSGGWTVHSKYLLIDAPFSGSIAHRRLVFTGSHNWTGPALTSNDETLLRIEDEGVFGAFFDDWSSARIAAELP